MKNLRHSELKVRTVRKYVLDHSSLTYDYTQEQHCWPLWWSVLAVGSACKCCWTDGKIFTTSIHILKLKWVKAGLMVDYYRIVSRKRLGFLRWKEWWCLQSCTQAGIIWKYILGLVQEVAFMLATFLCGLELRPKNAWRNINIMYF